MFNKSSTYTQTLITIMNDLHVEGHRRKKKTALCGSRFRSGINRFQLLSGTVPCVELCKPNHFSISGHSFFDEKWHSPFQNYVDPMMCSPLTHSLANESSLSSLPPFGFKNNFVCRFLLETAAVFDLLQLP